MHRSIIFFISVALATASLTLQVEPKSTDCFYQELSPGMMSRVTFFVLRGGLLDIDLKITGPFGDTIKSGVVFENGEHTWSATSQGVHSVCWNNEMARWTAKVIQFEWNTEGGKKEDHTKDKPLKVEDLNPMSTSLDKISAFIDTIQTDQRFLRLREQSHRDMAEDTNSKVMWMSIVESVVLAGLSIGQVYILRKFFSAKRSV